MRSYVGTGPKKLSPQVQLERDWPPYPNFCQFSTTDISASKGLEPQCHVYLALLSSVEPKARSHDGYFFCLLKIKRERRVRESYRLVAMIPVSEMVGRGSISRLQTCQHIYLPMCANTAHGQKSLETCFDTAKDYKQQQKINT